jgi:hypothetical protein
MILDSSVAKTDKSGLNDEYMSHIYHRLTEECINIYSLVLMRHMATTWGEASCPVYTCNR